MDKKNFDFEKNLKTCGACGKEISKKPLKPLGPYAKIYCKKCMKDGLFKNNEKNSTEEPLKND